VPATNVTQLLDRLDELKRQFDRKSAARIETTLCKLSAVRLADADSILRLHETLLFLRAYPQNASILSAVESILRTFPAILKAAAEAEIDLYLLGHPEASGIASLSVTDTFSFYIVRWLQQRSARQVSLDWDWFEDENRLAQIWPIFMPLLDEDGLVEANVPYREWLRLARKGKSELSWLFERFNKLKLSDPGKALTYDSQKLYVSWTPDYRATRTGMRRATGKIFYHKEALIQRREVQFDEELNQPAPPFRRLSEADGKRELDMAREASTIRYRELYGFTHGDPKYVYHANLGRGVDLVFMGLPADKRLPLRAYHAAMIYKNGVPVGYFEGLSLFERMEGGFNLYYTFRDGETAWLYARTLNALRHLTGVTAFSLDPYQIGHENKEGIESGAFWFYYKLGFRPTRSDLAQLAEKETTKLGSKKGYRTSAATLRKLAAGPMILELGKSGGRWNEFQVRNVGFSAQRFMAGKFNGNAQELRSTAVQSVSKILGVARDTFEEFADLALVLFMIPDLRSWSSDDKQLLVKIVRAKSGPEEVRFLKLMQRHDRLRREMIRLGSTSSEK
jgi:hypothetical protein